MRPLIGITCQPTLNATSQRPMYGLGQSYVHAVEMAGGIPLLIPPMGDDTSLRAIAERLDGILLSGGGDVDPARYGEEPIPQLGLVEPERDELELALARIAIDDDQPLFGICRGMQALNVAQGGTLYQDISAQQPKAIKHDYHSYEGPRDLRAHRITVAEGSPLAGIVGEQGYAVNSFHHQAVKEPGKDIKIIGWAEDGLAEAMLVEDHPFALAVQYHPEELVDSDPAALALFQAFVRACAERMATRAGR
ncbi:MAG TPA: gamma-glutamyl-gamma-aminobutyrate hydrolase family protein [Ktedonobacterales bacterium]|jgi:putative glutamine amidotransferase|nr:gamma-glutamyl-gamma-aminobutyrate hydrolase family protein [Ktedonobacterales bacterium]